MRLNCIIILIVFTYFNNILSFQGSEHSDGKQSEETRPTFQSALRLSMIVQNANSGLFLDPLNYKAYIERYSLSWNYCSY